MIAVADELAGAADLVRDKDSGIPGAVISGAGHLVTADDGPGAAPLRRAAADDLGSLLPLAARWPVRRSST